MRFFYVHAAIVSAATLGFLGLALGLGACATAASTDSAGTTDADPVSSNSDASSIVDGRAAAPSAVGSDGAIRDAVSTVDAALNPGDGGTARCDTQAGLDVFCLHRGDSFPTYATISYAPGLPNGLPAMGVGYPQAGYILETSPFTCVASLGMYGVSLQNTAGGKICDVIFDNTPTTTVTGVGNFVITVDSAAAAGTYPFAFQATGGTTVTRPGFFLRVN